MENLAELHQESDYDKFKKGLKTILFTRYVLKSKLFQFYVSVVSLSMFKLCSCKAPLIC